MLHFDRLEFVRVVGAQPMDSAFITEIHALTEGACGVSVPIEETYSRMRVANLAHYLYVTENGERKLFGYTLNEIYSVPIDGEPRTVNYFSSAFLLDGIRWKFFLYHFLGSLRITGQEEYLLVRTQNPLVISFFQRFCRMYRCRTFNPTHRRIPRDVRAIVSARFGQEDLVYPNAYGRRITKVVAIPKTKLTRDIASMIDIDKGDACILIAKRLRRPSTVFPPPPENSAELLAKDGASLAAAPISPSLSRLSVSTNDKP